MTDEERHQVKAQLAARMAEAYVNIIFAALTQELDEEIEGRNDQGRRE